MTEALPSAPVIANNWLTVPTVVLLLVHEILTPDMRFVPLNAVAMNAWVAPAVNMAEEGETTIDVRTGDTGLTVTLAVPLTDAFVAFTKEFPATDELNVTEALPSAPVIANSWLTVPTVVLLLVHEILTPDMRFVPLNAVAMNAWVAPAVNMAEDGETTIEVRTGGTGLTVTLAVPLTDAFVAFTKEFPATDELNVTEALPSAPVIANNWLTVPTVVLLLVHEILTPGMRFVPLKAVAMNAWVAPAVNVTEEGETTIDVKTGGTGLTVTLAVPLTKLLVALTKEVPAPSEMNVTEALPSAPVITNNWLTVPTVVLLLVHEILTPGMRFVPLNAVAMNAWVAPAVNVAEEGETTIEVRTGGNGLIVTLAVPLTDAFVALTIVVPAARAVNIVVAPPVTVIPFVGFTLPTVELLTVQETSIPVIGLSF